MSDGDGDGGGDENGKKGRHVPTEGYCFLI